MRRRTLLCSFAIATTVSFMMAGSLSAQQATSTEPVKEDAVKVEGSEKKEATPVAKPKLVKLDDVREHVGKEVQLEFTVKNSKLLDAKKICFLNSLKNYRDKKCFTVVIKSDALEVFAKAKIVDPAKHYLTKKIRVHGKVVEHRGMPQILVTKLDQIKIVKSGASDEKSSQSKEAKVATAIEDTKSE